MINYLFRTKNDKSTSTKCPNSDPEVKTPKQKSSRKPNKRKRPASDSETTEDKETTVTTPNNSPRSSGSDSENSFYAGEF